ncbi:hypothetical protein pb186bvf_006552 [Paramecium bursaria]
MANKAFTLVYYIVPQDNDDIESPNAFGISKQQDQITINDIRQGFPLQGQYIFRFRYKTSNHVVWMDMSNPNAQVPTFQNRIFIKATRISWNNQQENPRSSSKSPPRQVNPQVQPQFNPQITQQVQQSQNLMEF